MKMRHWLNLVCGSLGLLAICSLAATASAQDRDRGERSAEREKGSRQSTSNEPEETQPKEEPKRPEPEPEPTPQELVVEIDGLLEAGEHKSAIDLLKKFDEIAPPVRERSREDGPNLDGEAFKALHTLEVLRLKRHLLEKASRGTGRPVFEDDSLKAPGEDLRPTEAHGSPFGQPLDGIDEATREELRIFREHQKRALLHCRDLIEGRNYDQALALIDSMEANLDDLPDPYVWSSLRLLRAKCLVGVENVPAARGYIGQVCDYFQGRDAFGLQQVCQSNVSGSHLVDVLDYVLDAELLEVSESYVDIHPKKMVTRVEDGEVARGRFLVINPSPVEACFPVYVDGKVADRGFTNGTWFLSWDPYIVHRNAGLSREVCIPPFGQIVVQIEAPLFGEVPNQIIQISAGAYEIGDWHFSTTDPDEPKLLSEVIDASYSVWNPFYRTPISHELYYRGTLGHLTNLRVTASYPCAISYYNALTGQLMAFDSEGDGFFDDWVEDYVGLDRDYNNFPDLDLRPHIPVVPIDIEVEPIMLIPELEREVSLSVQVLDGGDWLETAQDVVLFP